MDREQTNSNESSRTIPATTYVDKKQYDRWRAEAEERNSSVSSFIEGMVEIGLSDIQIEDEKPTEMAKIRDELRQVRSERDDLQKKVNNYEKQTYHVGLGKIKNLIFENPGIDQREIANHIAKNSVIFTEEYLSALEATNYIKSSGEWFPPENGGDQK